MARYREVIAVGLLALAGCGSSNVSLDPGEWDLLYEITDATGPPDWPPDVIASMKQAKQTARKCITPDQAAAPTGELLMTDEDVLGCNFTDFTLAGGKIAGRMHCPASQVMGEVKMTMQGRYDARGFEMTSQMSVNNTGAPMTLKTRTTGRRIGDCPTKKKS